MHATYSTRGPVKPNTAAVAALGTLLIATTLAALLASSKRSINLDPAFALDGWPISFQPPRGWLPDLGHAAADAVKFHEPRNHGRGRLLVMQLVPKSDRLIPEELAMRLWVEWGYPGFERLLAKQFKPRMRDASFGPFPGVRIEDDAKGLVIAVGIVEDRLICLGLIYCGVPLNQTDLELIDRILDSITPARRRAASTRGKSWQTATAGGKGRLDIHLAFPEGQRENGVTPTRKNKPQLVADSLSNPPLHASADFMLDSAGRSSV